jgi:hypothetical protein
MQIYNEQPLFYEVSCSNPGGGIGAGVIINPYTRKMWNVFILEEYSLSDI